MRPKYKVTHRDWFIPELIATRLCWLIYLRYLRPSSPAYCQSAIAYLFWIRDNLLQSLLLVVDAWRIMRFLKVAANRELSLTKDLSTPPAHYAILSHTWADNNNNKVMFNVSHTWADNNNKVMFNDLEKKTGTSKTGHTKLRFCADQVLVDRLEYCWINTSDINKTHNIELSETITSMFY